VLGALGQLAGAPDGSDLVRQSDVESASATGKEVRDALLEHLGRDIEQAIGHRLPGLAGEHGVNEGGETVGDRVAHDPVLIDSIDRTAHGADSAPDGPPSPRFEAGLAAMLTRSGDAR
jgi:hypothetical protein